MLARSSLLANVELQIRKRNLLWEIWKGFDWGKLVGKKRSLKGKSFVVWWIHLQVVNIDVTWRIKIFFLKKRKKERRKKKEERRKKKEKRKKKKEEKNWLLLEWRKPLEKERKGKERKQTVVWENDGEFAQALKIFKKYCPRKKVRIKVKERKKETGKTFRTLNNLPIWFMGPSIHSFINLVNNCWNKKSATIKCRVQLDFFHHSWKNTVNQPFLKWKRGVFGKTVNWMTCWKLRKRGKEDAHRTHSTLQ